MTSPPTPVPIDGPMMDFSTTRKPVTFSVDGDLFSGPAEVAAETLIAYGNKVAEADTDEARDQLAVLKDLMEMFLWPEDFKRLCERLGDRHHPIGLEQLDNIANWLTEYHGMRPTQSSSDSSSPSSNPENDTDSTATAPVEASTPDDFPSPDSSTSSTST